MGGLDTSKSAMKLLSKEFSDRYGSSQGNWTSFIRRQVMNRVKELVDAEIVEVWLSPTLRIPKMKIIDIDRMRVVLEETLARRELLADKNRLYQMLENVEGTRRRR